MMKKRLIVGIAVILVAICALTALGISGTGMIPPPPHPPNTFYVSMWCNNVATGEHELFNGEWDGTQTPWMFTCGKIYYRMVPDGPGRWKPEEDFVRFVTVDIPNHEAKLVDFPQ